jgi:hypothetical protein
MRNLAPATRVSGLIDVRANGTFRGDEAMHLSVAWGFDSRGMRNARASAPDARAAGGNLALADR